MERILLVEPDYSNKYPPIGLMKLAMFHKMRGDYVEFYKGKAPYTMISKVDRIYITSLFTFYFDITVETILHYLNYIPKEKIYIGGIAVTLMKERFKEATGLTNILVGQLTDSSIIGYEGNRNIDTLSLDYDILDDVDYQYGIEDNFFIYTTRGCPRKCKFCGVKILEPEFITTNNIKKQVSCVREIYGDKRNIMIMDNNILFSHDLKKICCDLVSLGFEKDKATFIPENPAIIFFSKIKRRSETSNQTWMIVDKFVCFLKKFSKRIKKIEELNLISKILDDVTCANENLDVLIYYKDFIIKIVEKYRKKNALHRYVDFNQGIDARLLTEETMSILSVLPLRPFRLAYDSIKDTCAYYDAFSIAYKYGVRHFSNYMLYNFEDTPEDFWQRAFNNVILYNNHSDVSAFSFPMKYAPIDRIDRSYIGESWNKKYLSAMNIIMNVTKGVIAKEMDFFVKAYGSNPEEFREILAMPNEFIKYRYYFESVGLIYAWKKRFRTLDESNVQQLLAHLSGECEYNGDDVDILKYYKLTKYQAENQKDKVSTLLYL